jgi:hypothetical protein
MQYAGTRVRFGAECIAGSIYTKFVGIVVQMLWLRRWGGAVTAERVVTYAGVMGRDYVASGTIYDWLSDRIFEYYAKRMRSSVLLY